MNKNLKLVFLRRRRISAEHKNAILNFVIMENITNDLTSRMK